MTDTVKQMTRPCAKCPWLARYRGDDDYLRPGRRRHIVETLTTGGGMFPCHTTVDYDNEPEDGEVELTGDETPCAGFDLMMLRAERPNQMQRIRMRIGALDPDALLEANADVDTWTLTDALTEIVDDDDEPEPCSVVNSNCDAPAGYATGDGVIRGTESAEYECWFCGQPVCGQCSSTTAEGRMCDICAEDDEDA